VQAHSGLQFFFLSALPRALVPEIWPVLHCVAVGAHWRQGRQCVAVAAHWRQGLLWLLKLFLCSLLGGHNVGMLCMAVAWHYLWCLLGERQSFVRLPLVEACMFPVLALQMHQHGSCPVLHPLHRPEGCASMPVSFPKGMVSCMQGRESRILPCHFCRSMSLLLCPLHCCRKGRAGRVSDVDDVILCPSPISLACCVWVLVPVACVLESWTLQNTWARRVADVDRGFPRFAPCLQVVW